MIRKDFNISTKEAKSRLSSTLQHKLRVVLKCYTINNFILNEESHSFSFNKTNRIRGIKIIDSKDYLGQYSLEKNEQSSEGKEYKLSVIVN